MKYELKSNKGQMNLLRAEESVRVRKVSRLAQVNGQTQRYENKLMQHHNAMKILDGLRKLKEEL